MYAVKKRNVQTVSSPAPIGGLNARDALAAMPPNDAVTLDNFFPTTTTVNLRNGYVVWKSGMPSNTESLMPYKSATAGKLFAASGTAFYDVTSQGAVGAAVVSGLTNARWQHVNVGTPGGQFMLAVNGADKLRGYDGSSWWSDGDGAHDITGIDTSQYIHINQYKNRIFLVKANSFTVAYLPLNSIAGAASTLDLSTLFKLGGYLMAMMTWTVDNSAGTNEYAVFISSEGEVVVYLGTDPSVANNWAIQGTFRIGRPIGRRCFVKVGADIILISADGFFPLSKALLTDRSQLQDAISNKIINLVNNDVRLYGENFGWEPILYPIGNKLIINVPQRENNVQYQYVMNTITGAWCRFTGWGANCWATFGDALYFGGNSGYGANSGYIAKADYGYSDNGGYINGEAKTAFQYFGALGILKRFTMVRPTFYTAGTIQAALSINVDFQDVRPTATPSFSGTAGTLWNTGAWNTFPWGDVQGVKRSWQGVSGVGTSGALHMLVKNNATPLQWQSVDYAYEIGGGLF